MSGSADLWTMIQQASPALDRTVQEQLLLEYFLNGPRPEKPKCDETTRCATQRDAAEELRMESACCTASEQATNQCHAVEELMAESSCHAAHELAGTQELKRKLARKTAAVGNCGTSIA
ncbi:hypothetical protein MHYP_G00097980 [Metynnis hypsauchen]